MRHRVQRWRLQCPGPAVSSATPGCSVKRPQLSAMCTAAGLVACVDEVNIASNACVVKGKDLVAGKREEMFDSRGN